MADIISSMSFLFWIPWAIGVFYIIKMFFSSDPRKNAAKSLMSIIKDEEDSGKKQAYLKAVACLNDRDWNFDANHDQANDLQEVESSSRLEELSDQASPNPTIEQSMADRFKSLQNINVLLYVGAFMVVIAAGIFVGFNYQSLSGNFKIIFMTIFTLAFYFAGLWSYLKSDKIKEAGLTFLTIGLILFPLVGLAFFKFSDVGHGNIVWFATSIVTTVLYVLSLYLVKKTYLAYFVTFISLSLFESTVSLFGVPIYYFAWGMALFSIIFILISKVSQKDNLLSDSFALSGKIFLPISILLSLLTLGDSLMAVAINLLLASLFYFLANLLEIKQGLKEGFLALSLVLLPIGIMLILTEKNISNVNMAYVFGLLTVAYLVGYEAIRSKLADKRPALVIIISGLIPVLMCFLFVGDYKGIVLTLLYALLVNAYCFYRGKEIFNLVLALGSIMIIPKYILTLIQNDSLEMASLVYIILGFLLFSLHYLIKRFDERGNPISFIAYLLSFGISTVVLFGSSNHLEATLLFLFNALFFYGLSYLKNRNVFEAISSIILLLVAINFGQYLDLSHINYIYIFMIYGAILFGLSMLPTRKSTVFSYIGLVGVLFGAIYGVSEQSLLPISALALFGAMSLIKSFEEKSIPAQYFSYGVFVLVLEWLFNYNHWTQIQIFTLPWSLFFGAVALHRSKLKDTNGVDLASSASLVFLTIPILLQSFFASDGPVYALLLGLESVALILVGIAINYKLILRWGIVFLIIDVLYQSRVFIAAVPKWMIIGVVGIVLLVGATILLSKRPKDQI
ncbi:MAG: DUF2157 domain-containing protein [bacterium]